LKLHLTPSWRKYVEDYMLEDAYSSGAELSKSIEVIEKDIRTQFQLAGMKLVR